MDTAALNDKLNRLRNALSIGGIDTLPQGIEVIVLPGGTKITIDAAIGDLFRVRDALETADAVNYSGEIADLDDVMKLVLVLAEDRSALDSLNLLLSAPEWPGASGMEDVCEIVRQTGRKEIPDAPEWLSH